MLEFKVHSIYKGARLLECREGPVFAKALGIMFTSRFKFAENLIKILWRSSGVFKVGRQTRVGISRATINV
jgi:hypothetical protein